MGYMIHLETERLTIREFEEADAKVASYNSSRPTVAKEMSDMVLKTEEEALGWIQWTKSVSNIEDPWQVLAIIRKSDNQCIGLIGMIPQKMINREVEILYAIADEYQGQGYAAEAAGEMIKWFFQSEKREYLSAIVKKNNLPSQNVVKKIGFTFIEEREIEYDHKIYTFLYYRLKNPNRTA